MQYHRFLRSMAVLFALLSIGSSEPVTVSFAADRDCMISEQGVDSIQLGDSSEGVRMVFDRPGYEVRMVQLPLSVDELLVFRSGKIMLKCSLDDHGTVFLIDVYDTACKTDKGVGPGSTLLSVQHAYGSGRIAPSDAGHFLYFDSLPGILFLVNRADVPQELWDVYDDTITEDEEKRILSLSDARISAVSITIADEGQ